MFKPIANHMSTQSSSHSSRTHHAEPMMRVSQLDATSRRATDQFKSNPRAFIEHNRLDLSALKKLVSLADLRIF